MKRVEQLVNEAVFYEIQSKQWRKGLWNNLKQYIPEIERAYLDAVEYSNKYPGSPDASNAANALSSILNSVSESYKSYDLLLRRGRK